MSWVRAARHQRPVLFVGAGFSRNAVSRPGTAAPSVMATWSELTKALRSGLLDSDSSDDDALWVAQRYLEEFGLHTLVERIREAVPDDRMDPGPAHLALRKIRWHSVLTLNFDTLLERTFRRDPNREVHAVHGEQQLVDMDRDGTLPVLHLHGVLHEPTSIVVTLEHFRQYPDTHRVFLTVARQLLLQHPVMFLGFGATDPNFIAWSGWIRDNLRTYQPPWIRLQASTYRSTSTGFEKYWGTQLKTIGYEHEDAGFEALMDILGAALQELSDDEIVPYAIQLAELETAAT